jgi:membrane protease YdiL (CAAX protease family)
MQELAFKPSAWQRFWRFPITRIVTYFLVMLGFALALYFPILGLLKLFHLHAKGHAETADLVNELYLALCAIGAFMFMIRVVEKRTLDSAGFTRRGLGTETGLGLLIGGGLFSLVVGLTAAAGGYHVLGVNPHFAWLMPAVLFLGVAVFEETVFRGYIFQTLEGRWGSGIAVAGSSAAFGLVHLMNPVRGVTPAEKLAGPLFIVFEAGLLMAAGFLLTRRLWLPIGIHWGWNFFESALFGATDSAHPANPVYTLAHARFSGPFALTGGPFGPEAGVACVVVGTATGLLLLRLAVRRGQWRPRRSLPKIDVTHYQEVIP